MWHWKYIYMCPWSEWWQPVYSSCWCQLIIHLPGFTMQLAGPYLHRYCTVRLLSKHNPLWIINLINFGRCHHVEDLSLKDRPNSHAGKKLMYPQGSIASSMYDKTQHRPCEGTFATREIGIGLQDNPLKERNRPNEEPRDQVLRAPSSPEPTERLTQSNPDMSPPSRKGTLYHTQALENSIKNSSFTKVRSLTSSTLQYRLNWNPYIQYRKFVDMKLLLARSFIGKREDNQFLFCLAEQGCFIPKVDHKMKADLSTKRLLLMGTATGLSCVSLWKAELLLN